MNRLLRLLNPARFKNTYFADDKKRPDSERVYAPGTQIEYDPGLVDKLKSDHVQLVKVYGKIMHAIEHQELDKLENLLEMFLALFNAHALSEYIKLYVFLDYTFRDNREQHDTIMRFRQEMNEIGKVVRKFAHYWKRSGITDSNLAKFDSQIQQIGKVLTKRIKVEENQLYEIYNQAPNQFRTMAQARH